MNTIVNAAITEKAETPDMGPIRTGILTAVDFIDKNFYGGMREELQTALGQAKYRARGIDPNSDPWNQALFDPTEEALAPYAEALVEALDEHIQQQGMPQPLIDAREGMRESVKAFKTEAAGPTV